MNELLLTFEERWRYCNKHCQEEKMSDTENLVYIGMIVQLEEIPNADFIVSATVICGHGGKWKGIVKKSDFKQQDQCIVYLPDSLIPESEAMAFMKATHWRVKMRRFKGAPSEVLIMPVRSSMITGVNYEFPIGWDITELMGVTKYHKPVPAHLNGKAKGYFPSFIPKTDEPNYQRSPELIEALIGKPYYVTEKCDGSSTTAFRYKGKFGLCSRNLELEVDEENGYWKVVRKYLVEDRLPEGIAIQWETCGPGIQSNPMGLKEIDGFMFSVYNIPEHRYLELHEFTDLSKELGFPTCRILTIMQSFQSFELEYLGQGKYQNGKPREGVVVRSVDNHSNGAPISFKIINLDYEE